MGRLFIVVAALLAAIVICGRCQSDTQTSAPAPTRTPRPAATAAPTSTPRPAATAAPAASFTVDRDVVNVRSGPGTSFGVLGSVQRGQIFRPTGRNPAGDWLTFDFNGQQGWIYAPLLLVTRADLIPVAANIPAPPPTPAPAAAPTQTPVPSNEDERLIGSCTSLKEQGLVPEGGWPADHVNYTPARDRDRDGWACE